MSSSLYTEKEIKLMIKAAAPSTAASSSTHGDRPLVVVGVVVLLVLGSRQWLL